MAQIFAQNIIEVAIRHEYGGRPAVNVLHVFNDEGTSSDADTARDVLDNWQDHVLDLMDSDVSLIGASWRSLDPDDTNQGDLAPDPAKPVVGAGGGDGMPPNVAFLVKKHTANRQRGQRDGRMFLVGVPRAQIFENGSINSTFVATAGAALGDFLSGVNDAGAIYDQGQYLAVLNTTPASRVPGGPPVTLTHRMVNQLTLDPLVSTQRDRLR